MNHSRILGLLLSSAFVALAAACAAPSTGDDLSGSASDLTGSIGDERSCATAAAYAAASIEDFDTPADAELPAAVKEIWTGLGGEISHFDVAGIGDVYAVGFGPHTTLVDRNGFRLAVGLTNGGRTTWTQDGLRPLHCGPVGGSSSGSVDGGVPVGFDSGVPVGFDSGVPVGFDSGVSHDGGVHSDSGVAHDGGGF